MREAPGAPQRPLRGGDLGRSPTGGRDGRCLVFPESPVAAVARELIVVKSEDGLEPVTTVPGSPVPGEPTAVTIAVKAGPGSVCIDLTISESRAHCEPAVKHVAVKTERALDSTPVDLTNLSEAVKAEPATKLVAVKYELGPDSPTIDLAFASPHRSTGAKRSVTTEGETLSPPKKIKTCEYP